MKVRKVAYLSLEFLMGRSLLNSLHAINLLPSYHQAVEELGFELEELYEHETDAALGNGGLGRLAACFMDSLATLNYPADAYGLRYSYGLFEQRILNNEQVELPDSWLTSGNPWEVERLDVQYTIRFYGHVSLYHRNGLTCSKWEGGDLVQAVAYDNLIPGHDTRNTLNLRLWASRPTKALDMALFNVGDYQGALEARQKSENITSVLYPNDNNYMGKELRLKQQYFLVAATLKDIVTRFQARKEPLSKLPRAFCTQLNDTHPALGIPELVRILIDDEFMSWEDAWHITTSMFNYTNHTVLPEALESWDVSMIENLLPRHMQIIYQINHRFLQEVQGRWPGDSSKLAEMSIIEEPHARQDGSIAEKRVRMAHLAIVGSATVNGVAQMHTQILTKRIFKNFYELWPDKFLNITNGVTPRRWIQQANPALADLLTELIGNDSWRFDLSHLRILVQYSTDHKVQESWRQVKKFNKERLAELVLRECGIQLDTSTIFDVQVKRIHEYKRQLLNVIAIVHRYSELKRMHRHSPGLLSAVVPRSFIFAGKAAPGYEIAKGVIKLISHVSSIVNVDTDTNKLLKVVFIPNYNVKLAEVIIPGSDVSQHISTAGTEASGTSCMKFAMNGCLILGTRDGALIEIEREVTEENMFLCGYKEEEVAEIREAQRRGCIDHIDPRFQNAVSRIQAGDFGPPDAYEALLESVKTPNDHYLLGADFGSYLDAQARVDRCFRQPEEWTKMSMLCCAGMQRFSSDNSIREYANKIWGLSTCTLHPDEVPASTTDAGTH